MTAAGIRARGARGLADVRSRLARLEAAPPGERGALLREVDELHLALANVASYVGLLKEVHPEFEARRACEALQVEGTQLAVQVAQSRRIYDALSSVDRTGLDGPSGRALDLTLLDMRRAGVALDGERRTRAQALRTRITELSQTYARNIRDDVGTVELPAAALEALPADYRAAHPADARGLVRVTTDPPDYAPFMTYSTDKAARETLARAYYGRAPGNLAVLDALRAARHDLALTLGYPTWAAYNLEDRMAASPETVDRFIDEVYAAAGAAAERQYAGLFEIARRDDPAATGIGNWDLSYHLAQAKDARFRFDPREVRPYLEYRTVRQAILDIFAELYEMTFTPIEPEETWHASVEHFRVTIEGRPAGFISLDMHPRPGKNKWFVSFGYVLGLKGRQAPHNVLVCNFPDPNATSGPALMEHSQVVTFFHEFGHLVHGIVRGNVVEWTRLGRPAESDFMEAPSTFLEDYIFELDVLRRFARHVETGAAIPEELVRRLRAAREFGRGLEAERQASLSRQSLRLHDGDPRGRDARAVCREWIAREQRFTQLDDGSWPAMWEHIGSEAYSASYYTYLWSQAIAADLRTAFANGLMDTATARRYRDVVLAPGGNVPAADAVREFLGRPYDTRAFTERIAKSG